MKVQRCCEKKHSLLESAYDFKPHEKSMQMGYLTLLVAEKAAANALANITEEQLSKPFELKHYRGQLTVYMRLNNIAVPSIYGPSADDKNF
jgi:hypothetical protein